MNELTKRIDGFVANRKPGTVELVSYGSLIPGARHGNCPCCRWHQFMSDYERAAEITIFYSGRAGQTFSVIVCERCARRVNELEANRKEA